MPTTAQLRYEVLDALARREGLDALRQALERSSEMECWLAGGVVRDVRVNGVSLGEGGLNTMVAAWYGVPVALVTGDDVAVKQVVEVATSAKSVAVKRAINPRAVELRPFKAVHEEIEEAAFAGVRDAKKFQAKRPPSFKVEVQFQEVTIPEVAAMVPTMERPAPDTISFTTDSMPKAYTLSRLLYRYINPD